jgi:single-strand DNA-binding protein
MSGVNKAIVLGNVGNEPEVKYMSSGDAVANFSIATSEKWKDKQTGQQQEKTEWHRITAYKKLAEIIQQYVHKGSKIYIEGKLQTRKWTDQNGVEKYTTEIIANQMQMLDSRSDGAGGAAGSQPNGNGYAGSQAPNPAPQPATPASPEMDSFDDDIPF